MIRPLQGVFLVLLPWLLTTCVGVLDKTKDGWGWVWCECRWDAWKDWSDCSSDCFGQRERSRSVWLRQKEDCDVFTDCAPSSDGWQYEDCNQVCHNGGTVSGNWCNCSPGYTGRCCTNRIDCGYPDGIINGNAVFVDTYYGSTVTYSCNEHYSLTDGSTSRTCQQNSVWSGTKPRCAFVNSCASQPCQNDATCTNLLDDYECTCKDGWGGPNCQNDIQPPVMTGCLSNFTAYATESTKVVDWPEPTFTDPMGNAVDVVKNYNSPGFRFPWDDFTVQYVATKQSNGLQTECRFTISVRPTPCPELNIPLNGARICNGWKKDFGQYCIIACQSGYTIDPSLYQYETMYVCGASGVWIASAPVPDCDIVMSDPYEIANMQPSYSDYSYSTACTDPDAQESLRDIYMETITNENGFSQFCSNFPGTSPDSCHRDNVQIDC